MSSLSEKLTAALAQINAYQTQHPEFDGWSVYKEVAGSNVTGISASPQPGNRNRTIPQELHSAIDAAFAAQGLEVGTYFRVRNAEHEAAQRR